LIRQGWMNHFGSDERIKLGAEVLVIGKFPLLRGHGRSSKPETLYSGNFNAERADAPAYR
jgi:hypothetical protein